MEGFSTSSTSANFWGAALRIATPLMFGVLGALICERAGVLNLGIEGIFTAGAMAGWMAVYLGAGLCGPASLVAAATGAAFGLVHRAPDGAPWAFPARDGNRDHATGHERVLLTSIASRSRMSRRRPASCRSSR